MFAYGHQQRGYRLTGQDVRTDAARILEELLESRIDEDVKGNNKFRRIQTGQNLRRLSKNTDIHGNVVARSNTLPSDYREPSEKPFKQRTLETLVEEPSQNQNLVEEPSQNQKSPNVDRDDSGSSADTEDNLSVSEKRKKKSFFRRTKERLSFTFRHNQISRPGALKEKSNRGTDNSEKQKFQKNGTVINKQDHHLKTLIKEDTSADNTDSHTDKNRTVHKKEHPVKRFKRNILSSFRKSKKPSQTEDVQKDSNGRGHHQESNSDGGEERASREDPKSPKTFDIKQSKPSQHLINQKSAKQKGHVFFKLDRHNDSKQVYDHHPTDGSKSSTSEASLSLSSTSSLSHKTLQVSSIADAVTISGQSSASSGNIPSPRNSQPPFYNLSSIQNSILDNPGDEIEYIDDISDSESKSKQYSEDSKIHSRATGFQCNISNSLLVLPESSNQLPDNIHMIDFGEDDRVVSARRADGSFKGLTTLSAKSIVIVPENQNKVVYDELDGCFEELPEQPQNIIPDREALYSMIAQKLIDIGDSYSASVSDNRPRPQTPETQKPLSHLEIEIIECLRSTGDRISKQTTLETYQRFCSTMQHSLGSELSWNHVAFLYHTTKGVISAVGKGTRAAHLVKDFTLQYVSDTFASWIVDQGGFDILLSSDESDFGVD